MKNKTKHNLKCHIKKSSFSISLSSGAQRVSLCPIVNTQEVMACWFFANVSKFQSLWSKI